MKKAIISFLFALSVAVSFGQAGTTQTIVVTSSTGTITPYAGNTIPNTIYINTNGPVNLGNDVILSYSSMPPLGYRWVVIFNAQIALNGHTFTAFGLNLSADDLSAGGLAYFSLVYTVVKNSAGSPTLSRQKFYGNSVELATLLGEGNLPLNTLNSHIPLSFMDSLGRGRVIVGNSLDSMGTIFAGGNGNILIGDGADVNSVSVSGDIAITSAGVTSIAAGSIVNADVNASAAIAMTKLAALTASKPVVTNGSGVLTTANQISPAFGGTGQDFSASTGFATVAAGTFSVGAINETIQLQVSFESGYLGDFKIKMPYAGTVTGIYAYAIKAIAGTDNGTIVAKNNGGTTMTDGTITYTASDARGTAYTVSPSANNTFAAGDLLTFTTAKVTAGGVVQLSITVTRNN